MTTVHLFPDQPAGPRPAWQVIDAAREMRLTGELSLATVPATRIYLRDGIVYFAERATDGGLGIRLVLEGVLTRAQLAKGTILVNGAEHFGRLFERDPSTDRDAVELAVEQFVDDVLTRVAHETVAEWNIELYKRHASGVDRWYPHVTRVLTRVVERSAATASSTAPTAVEAPAAATTADATPAVAAPTAVPAPVVETAPAVTAPTVDAPVSESPRAVADAPAPKGPPARAPLPAPSMEVAAISAPPIPVLAIHSAPTDVVPVLPVDTLLQPTLSTAEVAAVRNEPVAEPEPVAVTEPEPVAAEPVVASEPEPSAPAAPAIDDLLEGGSGSLADDIAEAIRRTMAAYETQSA